MKIRFKRRSQNEILIWLLFLGPFVLAPLTEFLRFPDAVKYILDLVWCFLLLTMLFRRKRALSSEADELKIWIIAFVIYSTLNYMANYQSALYFLWGCRNNFRMYVFFFGVVYYFNKTNIDEAITLLDKLFYVNAAVMAIQFFILGYKQDNLGGIFGTLSGCNAYVNLFFCIILCNSLIRFYGKEESQKSIIFKIFLMLVLAAFAELKFFYVEFCILFVAVSLITAFSWKKLVLMLVAATTFFFGVSVFIKVFPNIQLSPAELLAYASSDHGYTSSGDLNRLNFVSPINSEYLNSILKQIFGLGLGNCDYATGIGFLETPFYLQNGWTHYAWMSTTFTYLENGWIGMIFFFGFFVLNAVLAWKKMKADTINKKYYIMAIMASLSAVMNAIYNISLRIEAGYMLYFMLAIPWCLSGSGTMEKQG